MSAKETNDEEFVMEHKSLLKKELLQVLDSIVVQLGVRFNALSEVVEDKFF